MGKHSVFLNLINKISQIFISVFRYSLIYRFFKSLGIRIANTFRHSYVKKFIFHPSKAWKNSRLYSLFKKIIMLLNKLFLILKKVFKKPFSHSEICKGLTISYRKNLSNLLYFFGLTFTLFGIASGTISLIKKGAIVDIWLTGAFLIFGFILLVSHNVVEIAYPHSFFYKLIYQFFVVEEVK